MEIQKLFYISLLLYLFGAGIVVVPSRFRKLAHELGSVLSILASVSMLIFALWFMFYEHTPYISLFQNGSFMDFTVDGLSSFFLLLIGIAGTVASIYGYHYGMKYHNDKLKILTAEYNLFLLSMCLVVTAYNALTFLLVWEIMAIASFLLVNHEQYSRLTWQAAYEYILLTNFGTALIMAAFFLLSSSSGQFSYEFFMDNKDFLQNKDIVFFLALFGFATKAGLVPMHSWLPKAHPTAPTHVSSLMSGVMLKMAVYGFLRFIFDFLGTPHFSWGVVALLMGLLSGFLGALFLQMQTDIKKILAYSSIEHLGLIFAAIGTGLLFAANFQNHIANICYFAALIHTLNHSFIKTTLFMVVGSIIKATHTPDINRMGGLIRVLPVTAVCALVGSMSIAALPFTAGFLGEWLLLINLVKLPSIYMPYGTIIGIVAMIMFGLISAMALGGFVRFYGMIFLGKMRCEETQEHLKDVTQETVKEDPLMNVALVISTLLCLLSGFFAVHMVHLADNILPLQLSAKMFSGIEVYNTEMKPLLWSILLVATVLVLYWSLDHKKTVISKDVWGCGVYPDARMQYSARGLSEPLRRIFSFYLKTSNKNILEQLFVIDGKKHFKPRVIQDIISERLASPINKFLFKTASLLRGLQEGGIQLYVSYILVTIICVLIYGTR